MTDAIREAAERFRRAKTDRDAAVTAEVKAKRAWGAAVHEWEQAERELEAAKDALVALLAGDA